jgi:hypothetical protein
MGRPAGRITGHGSAPGAQQNQELGGWARDRPRVSSSRLSGMAATPGSAAVTGELLRLA